MRTTRLIVLAFSLSACAHHTKKVDCERQLQPINLELPAPTAPDSMPEAVVPSTPGEVQP